MSSTFMGLETSKRGINTQQSALYTVGHNIANANTLGYSRQRVNMETTMGFPGVGMNAPKIPGFLGTGVQAGSVQRIRDQFIDNQYRQETTKLGYWSSKANSVSQMEDILTEPSEYGLNKAFDNFYASLQDLSTHPESSSTRTVVEQRGEHLADSFNYINKQLTQIQSNLKNEINVETDNVNSILKQIAALNEQIGNIEPNGYLPNDLYDSRDQLIDQLSEYFNVTVEHTKSGGNALPIAEGSLNVFIKLNDGSKVQVVSKNNAATLTPNGYNKTSTNADGTTNYTEGAFTKDEEFSPFTSFSVKLDGAETKISYDKFDIGSGKMISLIHSYGYADKTAYDSSTSSWNSTLPNVALGTNIANGLYPDKLEKLDQLAAEFAKAFNNIHQQGYTLAEKDDSGNIIANSVKGEVFFTDTDGNVADPTKMNITAANIHVSSQIKNNLNLIAASTVSGEEGNGKNAIELSNLKTKTLSGLDNASAQTFYEGVVGELGVQGQQAIQMENTATTNQLAITNNRASVSSVSLDEEMTNMITFQKAYNASARMITAVDEMLDKIINGMGRVGL